MPTIKLPGTTVICQKLLWICYYYARCFGIILIGIKQCDEGHLNPATQYMRNQLHNKLSFARQNQSRVSSLRAYTPKATLWLHLLIRFSLCFIFIYLAFNLWFWNNAIFSILVYSELVTGIICPAIMVIAEINYKGRLVRALNALFRLIRDVKKLHNTYELFQWTHVVFVALTVITFICEVVFCLQTVFISQSFHHIIERVLRSILLIEIYFNFHAATLLYVSLDAIYGTLNHYMMHEFIPRLRMVQTFGQITTSTQVDRLTSDMATFFDLFKNVHLVGSELHFLWQLPVASTLVCVYFSMIYMVYFMIWQYYEMDVLHVRFIPFICKSVVDILLLSVAAHRAVKNSQLIRCLGLENAMLLEDDKWRQQIDQFLYHIKLYEFKLSLLGLFDISNATIMGFIGEILTSIGIFLPFCIKKYPNQNNLWEEI